MTLFAETLISFSFRECPLNENIPRNKSLWSNARDDVIRLHSVLGEKLLTRRAKMQLALTPGFWVRPVPNESVFDAFVFLRPSRSAKGGGYERLESSLGPSPSVSRILFAPHWFESSFCSHEEIKAFITQSGKVVVFNSTSYHL